MDSYNDQAAINRQTVPLSKVLNYKDWPGLTVAKDGSYFIVTKSGGYYSTRYRTNDHRSYLDPLGALKYAYDLFLMLSDLQPSLAADREFDALANAPEPAQKQHSNLDQLIHHNALQIARQGMPIRSVLELSGIPFTENENGTLSFTILSQGRKEQCVTYPGNQEFHFNGVQAQHLDSYSLWKLVNEVLSDSPADGYAFCQYVKAHGPEAVASQL
jgi:hypothetical protein